MKFEVLVQQDLTIYENIREFGQSSSSADNYYIKYFEYELEKYLSDDVKRLWGNAADVTVIQTNTGLYSFFVPPELNDSLSVHEMAALVSNYWVFVDTDESLETAQDFETHADRLYALIQILKENHFAPDVICFGYPVSKDETNSMILHDWDTITSANQIVESFNNNR